MLDSSVSREFVERVDESNWSLISKTANETPFVAPTVASFAIGELNDDDTRTWTYSANAT